MLAPQEIKRFLRAILVLKSPQLMSLFVEATLSEITKHAAGISKECAWLLLIKLDHQFTLVAQGQVS